MRGILFSLLLIGLVPAAMSQEPAPLKIHMIGAGAEYDPVESLTAFKKHIETHYRVVCTTSFSKEKGTPSKLDTLEGLQEADVLFLFTRRMNLKEEQMKPIRAHWDAGKPIVGVRTASHAFYKGDNEIIDRQVFGGNYGGGKASSGGVKVSAAEGMADHPILKGVQPFQTQKLAYGQGKLADTTTVIQIGENRSAKLPVAWTNTYKGGRMFYTSSGSPAEFKNEHFQQMIVNALFWTAQRDIEKARKVSGK